MKFLTNLSILSILLISNITLSGQASVPPNADSEILTHAMSSVSNISDEASHFKILNFGAYITPGTNQLHLGIQKEIVYTKAELINKNTNKLYKSISLNASTSMIDLSGTPSASYLLILTNKEGNISVEELTIL